MISNENSLSKVIEYIDASNSKTVVISHLLHRDIGGCLEKCGGCCKKVTLDYLESSERWENLKKLHPEVAANFTSYQIGKGTFFSDAQEDNKTGFCRYLSMETGLCTIHDSRPLLCQSTPLKFKMNPSRNRVILTSETYGRKHAFRRVDGERGAKCVMLPPTEQRQKEDLQFLNELLVMAEIFQLPTSNLKIIIKSLKHKKLNSDSFTLNF